MPSQKRLKLPWRSAIGIALAVWAAAAIASGGAGASSPARTPLPQPFNPDDAHPVWAPGDTMARNPDGSIMMVRRGPPPLPPEVAGGS